MAASSLPRCFVLRCLFPPAAPLPLALGLHAIAAETHLHAHHMTLSPKLCDRLLPPSPAATRSLTCSPVQAPSSRVRCGTWRMSCGRMTWTCLRWTPSCRPTSPRCVCGFWLVFCVGVVVQLQRTPECPSRVYSGVTGAMRSSWCQRVPAVGLQGVSVQLLNTLAVLCRLPVDAAHRIERTPYHQTPNCLPHCCPPVRLHRTLLARSLARPPESAPSPAAPSAATRSAAAACAPATPPPGGQDPQTWAARHRCTVKSPFGECPLPPLHLTPTPAHLHSCCSLSARSFALAGVFVEGGFGFRVMGASNAATLLRPAEPPLPMAHLEEKPPRRAYHCTFQPRPQPQTALLRP